jgi:hypothetical protein
MRQHSHQQDKTTKLIMIKVKYIRTSSGSMMPIYPHPSDNKNSSQSKTLSSKTSKSAVNAKTSNSKG